MTFATRLRPRDDAPGKRQPPALPRQGGPRRRDTLGVHESLLYRWRRLMGAPSGVADPPGFVAVTLTPEPVTPEPVPQDLPAPGPAVSPVGVLEIALPGGTRVRLDGPVDPTLAVAVLSALAASGRAP